MMVITTTRPEHFAALAAHQRLCFPTMDPVEWMSEEHFASQVQIFPQGQHIVLDGDRVIGQSSTFRCRYEQAFTQHTYHGITAGNLFTNHDPQGEWLYGADMSVHPDYRGRGVATLLYTMRKTLIRQWGLRGMVAGGALPGYAAHRDRMHVDQYIAEVVAGRLTDPTLTAQLRNGFVVRDVLRGYIGGGDLVGNDATLIVWEAEWE